MSGLLPALGVGGGGSGGLSGLLTTHAAVQLAAGGLSGLVAMSAAIATGVVPVGGASAGPPTLPLVVCPGSPSTVAVANIGDEMLVTAKSADGGWLRVYVPGPVAHDGWVPAGSIELQADGSSLPVARCGEVAAATGVPGPSVASVPATATTDPTASPTAKATAKPTTAPTPTATAQVPPPTKGPTAPPPATLAPTPTPNVGPVFTSGPTSSVATMFADPSQEGDCWGLPRRTIVKVEVGDPNGVSGVQLFVQKPGATTFAFLRNFSNHGSYWSTLIDAYYDHINAGGTMSFYAVATDGTGLTTKSKTASVAVRRCDIDATIGGGPNLQQFPDGAYDAGTCGYSGVPWYFSIRDPDGAVASAILSLVLTRTGTPTQYQTVTLKHGILTGWTGNSTTWEGDAVTTWTVSTTDVNGGTTVRDGTVVVRRGYCIK